MKYLITESKLEQGIYDYMDELFSSENGNTEIHRLNTIDEDGKDMVGSYDFVNDDYYDGDNQDYLFSWTDKEYYELLTPNYITQDEMEKLSKKAPNVEIYDKDKIMTLNSVFGEMWKPVFIKWFQDKVNLPIKTLYAQS
jgi:hypothetical protein